MNRVSSRASYRLELIYVRKTTRVTPRAIKPRLENNIATPRVDTNTQILFHKAIFNVREKLYNRFEQRWKGYSTPINHLCVRCDWSRDSRGGDTFKVLYSDEKWSIFFFFFENDVIESGENLSRSAVKMSSIVLLRVSTKRNYIIMSIPRFAACSPLFAQFFRFGFPVIFWKNDWGFRKTAVVLSAEPRKTHIKKVILPMKLLDE